MQLFAITITKNAFSIKIKRINQILCIQIMQWSIVLKSVLSNIVVNLIINIINFKDYSI